MPVHRHGNASEWGWYDPVPIWKTLRRTSWGMSDPDLNLHQFQNSDRCERTNLVFRPAPILGQYGVCLGVGLGITHALQHLVQRQPDRVRWLRPRRMHCCTSPSWSTGSCSPTTSTGARSRWPRGARIAAAGSILHHHVVLALVPRPEVLLRVRRVPAKQCRARSHHISVKLATQNGSALGTCRGWCMHCCAHARHWGGRSEEGCVKALILWNYNHVTHNINDI
jgi:hypothetical protein